MAALSKFSNKFSKLGAIVDKHALQVQLPGCWSIMHARGPNKEQEGKQILKFHDADIQKFGTSGALTKPCNMINLHIKMCLKTLNE